MSTDVGGTRCDASKGRNGNGMILKASKNDDGLVSNSKVVEASEDRLRLVRRWTL